MDNKIEEKAKRLSESFDDPPRAAILISSIGYSARQAGYTLLTSLEHMEKVSGIVHRNYMGKRIKALGDLDKVYQTAAKNKHSLLVADAKIDKDSWKKIGEDILSKLELTIINQRFSGFSLRQLASFELIIDEGIYQPGIGHSHIGISVQAETSYNDLKPRQIAKKGMTSS